MKKFYALILPALLLTASCKHKDEPEPAYHSGEADLSCYIAIGNSLTAGYSSGSLYRSGQKNSYPAIMAKCFGQVGGGDFVQPLLPGEAGWPGRKYILGTVTNCADSTYEGYILYNGPDDTQGSTQNISNQGPFNNLGIPGVRCIDFLTAGYSLFNYYATHMFAHPDQALMDIIPQKRATFFSLWLGSNDVLGYATSGGTGLTEGVGLNDISPLNVFQSAYDTLVNRLTANKAKGILITIPDITQIPYFTTIASKGLDLTAQAANDLNQYYQNANIRFTAGKNYYVISDTASPLGFRKMESGEYLLLTIPLDSLTCGTWGTTTPIADKYVLTRTETNAIQQATQNFNQVITTAAANHHLALMNASDYLQAINKGITAEGLHFDGRFIRGGVFSLDGIHLTEQGYALIANQMIQTINTYYHAQIPTIKISSYKGIE